MQQKNRIGRHPYGALFIAFAAFCLPLMFLWDMTVIVPALLWPIYIGAALCAALIVFLALTGKLTDERLFLLILIMGFLLRLAYIYYSPAAVRQHDVNAYPEGGGGHSKVIRFYAENGFRLPQIDVRSVDQLYHPPLWHLIAAVFYKIMTAIGFSFVRVFDSLQLLSVLLSTLCGFLGLCTLRALDMNGAPLRFGALFLMLHPAFFLMSGFLNNDLLMITLVLAVLLFAVRWFKNPTFGRILPLALALGLAMMTKLNAVLVAPAHAVLFVWKLVERLRARSGAGRLIAQFAVFGGISIPLGIWWPVRNFLLFDMPLNYVNVPNSPEQFIGDYPRWMQLFSYQFRFPYISLPFFNNYHAMGYDLEYSLNAILIKTSVVGEFTFGTTADPVSAVVYAVEMLSLLIAALSVVALVAVLIRAVRTKSPLLPLYVFFAVYFAATVVSVVSYLFQIPYICSVNFRFIAPLLVPCAVFIATWLGGMQRRWPRIAALALAALFCTGSCLVYILLSGLI